MQGTKPKGITETIEWFKVDETLPNEDHVICLVQAANGSVWESRYFRNHWYQPGMDELLIVKPVYWCYCPKGPKQ